MWNANFHTEVKEAISSTETENLFAIPEAQCCGLWIYQLINYSTDKPQNEINVRETLDLYFFDSPIPLQVNNNAHLSNKSQRQIIETIEGKQKALIDLLVFISKYTVYQQW